MTGMHEFALATAQSYFDRWVTNDVAGLCEVLSEDVKIILPFSGADKAEPSTVFDGLEQSLSYLGFAFATFERLTFVDPEWVVSDDARFVYMHAFGKMTTTESGKHYDNVYIFRLELREGLIIRVLECTNPIIWTNLGIG